jgi:hypothetical protein
MDILWFLPCIILIGIITSIQDIKSGKIRNIWIIIAIAFSVLVNSGLITYYWMNGVLNVQYVTELLTNLAFAVAVGFGLWYSGIWTAGDGKLFIAYSALIPLSVYSFGYQKYFPSFNLLINIFIPALIILLAAMLFKIKLKHVKEVSKSLLKEFFQIKQILNSAAYLFAISWLIQLLLSFAGMGKNYILSYALTLIFFSSMQKKLGKKILYIMLAVSVLRLVFDRTILSWQFTLNFVLLMFAWSLLRSFLTGSIAKLGTEIFTKDVNVSKLAPGMVLCETIAKLEVSKKDISDVKKISSQIIKSKGQYYVKMPKSAFALNSFIGEEPEGVTKAQILKIKKLGVKKIRVSQTLPFAPFMFLGAILTIIAKGNVLIAVVNLFS